MKNYIKSAQFAAILTAIFAWLATLLFFKSDGRVLGVFMLFALIITFLIPFCSTEPDDKN